VIAAQGALHISAQCGLLAKPISSPAAINDPLKSSSPGDSAPAVR
jgi:hypothetical protein